MGATGWQFRPSLWPTLATLVAVPLLASLGFWQLDRAAQKDHRYEAYRQLAQSAPLSLDRAGLSPSAPALVEFRRVRASGSFDQAAHYLLDNQVMDGRPGYLVYTPFVIAVSGLHALVNRGWVAADPDRRVAPVIDTPAGEVELLGELHTPAQPGIVLGESVTEDLGEGRLRVQRLDLAAMAGDRDPLFLPLEIRLDPASAGGFLRHWTEPGSGSDRHRGYAFQWFAMSAVVVIIFFWLNLKRADRA